MGSEEQFAPFAAKMAGAGLSPIAIKTFNHYYDQLVAGETGLIPDADILPLTEVPDLELLPDCSAEGSAALEKTVLIKLNGGLGTSMGLEKAKSLLPAKNGLSFLDIIMKQVISQRAASGARLPVVFMNSFRTEADTLAAIKNNKKFVKGQTEVPFSFVQNRVPKILQDSYAIAEWSLDRDLEWCPPGHGDIYTALAGSGLLKTLLDQGYEYAFVANADNLGAVVDPQVLGHFVASQSTFMMEVADRAEADKKGGYLAKGRDGRLILGELAQCPDADQDSFQDCTKYRYFNTNTIWIDLRALSELLEAREIIALPLIRNSKTLDPRNAASPKVYQLETAMGAAIELFPGASVLRVPRTRFRPVKKTDDLLVLWSDVFTLDDRSRLVDNPARVLQTPVLVSLDPRYFSKIDDFCDRFPHGAPSLIRCCSLSVDGDVSFGRNVVIEGVVSLLNVGKSQLVIKNGTVLGS